MEYTFQNTDGTITQIELREFQLVVRKGGEEYIIPHSAISHVSLERKKNCFSIGISSTDFGAVRICYDYTIKDKNQSRQYASFVRVLHYQLLQNHTKAEFYSGFKPTNMVEKISSVFLVAVLLYSVEEYYNFTPLSPLILAILTVGLAGVIITGSYLVSSPKNYQPTDIPLTMLPPAL